mmetsp:Transcript_83556/g.240083  ORF Transcript_83556/g.240083 Transcript_83556/m.240083 type:complete len:213 (+) Transcript_83556:675-1313(+)
MQPWRPFHRAAAAASAVSWPAPCSAGALPISGTCSGSPVPCSCSCRKGCCMRTGPTTCLEEVQASTKSEQVQRQRKLAPRALAGPRTPQARRQSLPYCREEQRSQQPSVPLPSAACFPRPNVRSRGGGRQGPSKGFLRHPRPDAKPPSCRSWRPNSDSCTPPAPGWPRSHAPTMARTRHSPQRVPLLPLPPRQCKHRHVGARARTRHRRSRC